MAVQEPSRAHSFWCNRLDTISFIFFSAHLLRLNSIWRQGMAFVVYHDETVSCSETARVCGEFGLKWFLNFFQVFVPNCVGKPRFIKTGPNPSLGGIEPCFLAMLAMLRISMLSGKRRLIYHEAVISTAGPPAANRLLDYVALL